MQGPNVIGHTYKKGKGYKEWASTHNKGHVGTQQEGKR